MWIFWGVIWGIPLSPAPGRSPGTIPGSLTPLWHLDVRTLGYTPPAIHEGGPLPVPPIGSLCFLSSSQIIVTYVERVAPTELPHRKPENISLLPLRLCALLIDADTGKVQVTRKWPTASDRARIAPAPGERFVVITPEKLQLYSADVKPLRRLDLPDQTGIQRSLTPSASPGGAYLLIEYDPNAGRKDDYDFNKAELRREFIDTENLRLIRAWTLKGMQATHPENISDEGTALTSDSAGRLKVGKPGGPWTVVCEQRAPQCTYGFFVANNAFFSRRAPRSAGRSAMQLMLINGQVIFEEQLSKKQYVQAVARSAGGQRFAIAIDKGKGGSKLFDVAPHYSLSCVKVYDIANRRWIYKLNARKEGIKSISGLALSSDGRLIALIDQDGILQEYRLPE